MALIKTSINGARPMKKKKKEVVLKPSDSAIETWAKLKALGHEVTAEEVLAEWIRQRMEREETPLQRMTKRNS